MAAWPSGRRVDKLDFEYSLDATSLSTGTWTSVNNLDFTAPVTSGTIGALDGNANANRTNVGYVITGLSISNATTFWIRWVPFNATGNDDGLAIDDFVISANPSTHYTILNSGGILSITDIAGNSESFNLTEAGNNIRLDALGRTYSLNSGSATPFPLELTLGSLNSITVNTAEGNDTINTGAFANSFPDLTLNGGQGDDVVYINGDITFLTDEFLNIDLQDDDPIPGVDQISISADVKIKLSGTGAATLKASRNIVFNTGSSLTTSDGDLIVEANQQSSPTTGSFIGIQSVNGSLQVSGIGAMSIKGKGGTSGVNQHGISLSSGGDIIGGTSGTITIEGKGGLTTSGINDGVIVSGSGSTISSQGSSVTVTGYGGGTGASSLSNIGVLVTTAALITAGGMGDVNITGTGGLVSANSNDGVRVTGANAKITSSGGNVMITGFGGGIGSSATNVGVAVISAGVISAGGSGTVYVQGTGGVTTGVNSFGVSVQAAGSAITSTNGDVTIFGQGGGTGGSTLSYGVSLSSGGIITAGGTGNVSVNGTGGSGTGANNHGVIIQNATSLITSSGGNVNITAQGGGSGTAGNCTGLNLIDGTISSGGSGTVNISGTGGPGSGASNYGVLLNAATSKITSSSGDIFITGIEGGGTSGYGINSISPSSITTLTNGGNISLKANSILLGGSIVTPAADSVFIEPFSNDVQLLLGISGDVIGGPLQMTDVELDQVTTGTLILGSSVSGPVSVDGDITRPAATNIRLISGDDIIINTGLLNANGGNVVMEAGSSPAAVRPLKTGTDVNCNLLSFAGGLESVINGLVADFDYSQLNVIGAVNLTGTNLLFSGTHTPVPGESFIIISNDGNDAVTGTFNGLIEGANIPNFLGSNWPAKISYVGGDGNDVVITVLSPEYVISNTAGKLEITDLAGNGETLNISESGSNINFAVTGRHYSLNGGAITSFPVNFPLAGLDSIIINAQSGNDFINVAAFTTPLPNLTINGGTGNDIVNMNGSINFLVNASLNLDLQNDDTLPGSDQLSVNPNAHLVLTGSGSAMIKVSRNINIASNAVVQVENGDLVVEANYQAVPNTDNFNGVYIQNGLVHVTGSGSLMIKGKAGQTNSANSGVFINSGGEVIGGTSGDVIIEGIGALSTIQACHGVMINGAGCSITSAGADVFVTGYGGGSGTSMNNNGVEISNGGMISAGAAGNVTVNGTGGNGAGSNNNGIRVNGINSQITSSGGNVTVNGTGAGASNSSLGGGVILLSGGKITSGGIGNVEVTGIGGLNTGNSNDGVSISSAGSAITSNGGNVQVTGYGGGSGTSVGNYGITLANGGSISAGGQGEVSIEGTGGAANGDNNIGVAVNGSGSTVSSSGGNVFINGQGGGISTSGMDFGVSVESGAMVTSGGWGAVTIDGVGGNSGGNNNHGVRVRSTGSLVTSSGGDIIITGEGGGTGSSQSDFGVMVELGGKIMAGGQGNVNIQGTGALNATASAHGVYVSGANTAITTSGGNTNVTGFGMGTASSSQNVGVWVVNAALISAGGLGSVTVTGTGGMTEGNANSGVVVQQANSLITSSGGNVVILGQAGGTGASQINRGVLVTFGGTISAGGAGAVMVTGTGGLSMTGNNYGVSIENSNSKITSAGGDIHITGIEGSNSFGITNFTSGGITTSVAGGNITLTANSIYIAAAISTDSEGAVSLQPYSNGRNIEITTTNDAVGNPLRLSDTELDYITTGRIKIGHSLCDTIFVSTNITRSAATDMQFITGGDIILNGGSINTMQGTLHLQAGSSPKAIYPLQTGNDVNVDTLQMEDNLAIRIDGTTPDVQFTQLNVIGKINLNGVSLLLSGNYAPLAGDTFIIVSNDDVDMMIGNFNGLSEGDTLFDFLGSEMNATITYIGGDGNDAVIRVVNPCDNPDIPVIVSSQDTICHGTLVSLMITNGDLGGGTEWHWYSQGCGITPVATGTSIMVAPDTTTTYFVRGEGGCVTNSQCANHTVVVNAIPDPTIQVTASSDCYFTDNIYQPLAPEIPGATYQWTFGANAVPPSANGYGPHSVSYTAGGTKTVKLVIYPNGPGAQCPDSSSITRNIIVCTTQILGRVKSVTNNPIPGVNVKLFTDVNLDGVADNGVAVRNVNTNATGTYAMANITPGSYVIVETQPANWLSFDDGDTSDDGDLVPNIDSLDNIIPVTVVPSEVDSMNLFIESPAPGSITGNVFDDVDQDMAPDPGEGIAEVTIRLFQDLDANGIADTGTPLAEVVTDANGQFIFTDVPVGNYVITEVQPPDYISIKDFDPTNDGDIVPNINTHNDTIPLTITNAENDAQNFFIDGPACGLVVTNTSDDGIGSLRHSMACAQPGDTITFHNNLAGNTILITSSILLIDKNLVFMSTLTPRISINSEIDGLFEISPGVQVEFIDLNIISGLSPGLTGAAFENQGHLILHDTNVKRNPSFPSGEYLIRNNTDSQFEIKGSCQLEMN